MSGLLRELTNDSRNVCLLSKSTKTSRDQSCKYLQLQILIAAGLEITIKKAHKFADHLERIFKPNEAHDVVLLSDNAYITENNMLWKRVPGCDLITG